MRTLRFNVVQPKWAALPWLSTAALLAACGSDSAGDNAGQSLTSTPTSTQTTSANVEPSSEVGNDGPATSPPGSSNAPSDVLVPPPTTATPTGPESPTNTTSAPTVPVGSDTPSNTGGSSNGQGGNPGTPNSGGQPAMNNGGKPNNAAGNSGTPGAGAEGGSPVASGGAGPSPVDPGGPFVDPEPGVLRAFPGAEGFGRDASGGRGGSICHVTTLADAGAGSLRDCVSQPNRTVVFNVGGWINLASNLGITQDNITIAGQTAPGAGVGVRGRKFSIGAENVILRYLRIRRGILVTSDRDDAMSISSAASNIIVDHCSVAFGTDETLSMPGDEGIGPRNLTLQWSIVAWGLQRNNHSAGSLFTSNQTTIHHTLWAFNKTRNPRARSELAATRGQGGHLDWVNNIIYGWNAPDPVGEAGGWSISHDPFILAGTSNGEHAANAVGNYFISTRSANYGFHKGTPNFSLYFADNALDGNANGVLDVSKSDTDMVEGTPTFLSDRIAGPEVATDTPAVAYERVLAGVGVTAPARDELDELLVSLVESQGGTLLQQEPDLVAQGIGDDGYGTLENATRPAGFDEDADGMPNAWEDANGFDASDPSDGTGDADTDGYTNVEEYLNSLAR